jgi:hypothetical protein
MKYVETTRGMGTAVPPEDEELDDEELDDEELEVEEDDVLEADVLEAPLEDDDELDDDGAQGPPDDDALDVPPEEELELVVVSPEELPVPDEAEVEEVDPDAVPLSRSVSSPVGPLPPDAQATTNPIDAKRSACLGAFIGTSPFPRKAFTAPRQ